jgi:hypothetical protein
MRIYLGTVKFCDGRMTMTKNLKAYPKEDA